jgi:hypothetical protein
MKDVVAPGSRSGRWLWWVLVVAGWSAACAGRNAAPGTAASFSTTIASTAVAPKLLGGRPPLAGPGEKLAYRISVQGIEVGEFVIAVESDPGGLVVRSMMRTIGLAALVNGVHLQFTSHLDGKTGKLLRFLSEERPGTGRNLLQQSEVRVTNRVATVVPVMVRRGDGATEQREDQVVRGEVWDLNSLMIALRQFDGGIGSKLDLEVFRTRSLWHTQLTVSKREQRATELGRIATLRFDGSSRGLRRNGERSDDPERQVSIWISDDADRIPILLVGVTDYGDLRMELVSYTPADGQAGASD